ncbi:hypothetical protein ACFO5R_10255 [Halosolutus amylolyticus]|uniref:DUF7305 domain-containing protein n=1 Tax=Halosolutus amylolyticus TaxID=2932267 RepID=A0ABD5PNY3_9EURY|nr:hypothetical protein [Halosolutus amylolyticus]
MSRDRRGAGSADRGQSAMIGIVLLVGMVAVTSAALFLVAGDVLTSTEAQTEEERVEQVFVELSQKMGSAWTDNDVSHSMDLDAGERGAVARAETGWINVSSEGFDEPINETVGTIEWEGDGGSTIAYEAGAVFSETGNETRVVSVPPMYYDATTETLTLPVTTVSGDSELDSGDISFNHDGTTVYADSNVVEDADIRITIKSEYYRGWERFFTREAGDTIVRDIDHENRTVSIRVGYLDIDDAFDSGVTLSEPAGEQGNVDFGEEEVRNDRMPELDDVIEAMLEEMKNGEYSDDVEEVDSIDGNETYTNGTYLADEVLLEDTTDVTFDLEDGNATLMVDGDVELAHPQSSLSVENATGTNHSLKIYVTGNLSSSGDMGGTSATYTEVYGTSETAVAFDGGSFTGTIYAPSDDWTGTNPLGGKGKCSDEQVCLLSNPDLTGSVVASSAHFQGGWGSIDFTHDEDLADEPVELYPDEYDLPPQLTYLNVAHHEIDVKNS